MDGTKEYHRYQAVNATDRDLGHWLQHLRHCMKHAPSTGLFALFASFAGIVKAEIHLRKTQGSLAGH